MRLATFIPPQTTGSATVQATDAVPPGSGPIAGEIRGDKVVAFTEGTVLDRIRSVDRTPATGPEWDLDRVTLLAPIPVPRQIFCLGLNYPDHVSETGAKVPEQPSIFTKPGTASTGPSGPVICPKVVRRLDYEAELVAIAGPDNAIAGYAVANDVSARDLQKRERHWTRAKGADTFCPWGPWITTADEVPAPEQLAIRCWVNGDLRQDGNSADLIFGISEIVGFLTETCTLEPGDLILTIRVGRHPLFERQGLDVNLDLPVTITEAALGATVNAPTPGGGRVDLKVPAGSSSGAKLRLRGRGIETEDGKKGDLYAIIKIVAPKDLSDEDKATLKELGSRLESPRTGPYWSGE